MKRQEFNDYAKRDYTIKYVKSQWNIEDDVEAMKTLDEIISKLENLLKYGTRDVYCTGEGKIYISDFEEDPFFYAIKYIDREIKILVEITLNDLDDFENEDWN